MRLVPTILLAGALAAAQSSPLHKGAWEMGLHTGGGASIAGGARGSHNYWMLAGRVSRVLTGDLGSGALRGNLEYGVEAIPAMVVFQSTTVYAAGFSPLQLRYNFTAPKTVAPFVEIGGGILGSSDRLPEFTNNFNFISGGGVGLQFLRDGRPSVAVGMRYQHISNAGLARSNPGINSIYFHAGLSWWR
jgi:hypothetical protein